MSITYELREWAKEFWEFAYGHFGDKASLLAIADRIDAEHEAKVAYWQEASYKDGYDEGFASADDWYAEHAEELAEHGWARLPRDADGKYIRIGDVMEWVRYKDDDPTIVRTVIGIGNGVFFAWSDEQGRYAQYEAHAYRHHHAPTVEDVLDEIVDKANAIGVAYASNDMSGDEMMDALQAIIAEYAAKLRLREEA